jgi:hypothetical protein
MMLRIKALARVGYALQCTVGLEVLTDASI